MKNYLTIFLFAAFFASVTSCGNDDEMPEETEEETLEGNYFGTWVSSTASVTYPNTVVSAKLRYITSDKTVFGGEFFVSNNFTSCCGSGDNDGSILYTLDGNSITDFTYTDIIPNCGGTFKGTGTLDSNKSFKVDFTGTDCDGDHIGVLTLTKEQ